MNTPITPESLIELGFEEMSASEYRLEVENTIVDIIEGIVFMKCGFGFMETNATTIEDIKNLIRLFK